MLKNEHPGNLMERKERELQPAVAGASNDTPGGHRSQGQVIQTLGGPPQARIGTHGNGATHFIGCRCRPKHALAWNSRWWGELTVVGRIVIFFFQLIQERTTTTGVVATAKIASRTGITMKRPAITWRKKSNTKHNISKRNQKQIPRPKAKKMQKQGAGTGGHNTPV